jgi:alanyl-tRNA synthetase
MQTANEIRSAFLEYFRKHGHEVVSSSPLVPRNDPTLLFTNAGMVQFKNVFTGQEKRPYARAATAQKCVRAGGKHNDLENVGYTARHHTFFEMLGNFSFGDYFKPLAIELAWNLITKEFGLPKERLWTTVYSEDDEAFDLWKKIAGLPESRIIRIPTSDNFWAMGDTGPCGPCSEIFFDHGPEIAGGPPGSPDADGDRYIEIWNLVFMQFEQVTKAERVALPRPSIDTGMGLERLAAVLQGKHDNYDIDMIRALILASAEATGTAPDGPQAVSHRVIADHLRSTSFLIADGVLPSNEGRGYVLRRIMRRAMRHAHRLGAKEPLMWRLVPALVAQMGQAYPELGRAQPIITETLRLEETRFRQTLERGLKLLEEETGRLGASQALAGDVAFRLYDTFGFPLDLTQDILRGQGRSVDTAGFDKAMAEQRAAARKAWAGSGEATTDRIWFELKEKVGATEFLGYATDMAEGQVLAIVKDGKPVERAKAGDKLELVVNQTPFYGESGGQMGDTGIWFNGTGLEIVIDDTQKKLGELWVHSGEVRKGEVTLGDAVEMRVDRERRDRLRAAHSATHLLHEALRRRLGAHVTQKGSLVAPDRLRFDFSHPKPIAQEDLAAIEAEVNRRVRRNAEVATRLMTPDAAVEAGALALFGEKYGEEVRVVSMGGSAEGGGSAGGDSAGGGGGAGAGGEEGGVGEDRHFSTELCGGTHVSRTGDIGIFRIVSESAVAAGVRRIEALTGAAAERHAREQDRLVDSIASLLKVAPADLPVRLQGLLEERRRLERELVEARKAAAAGGANAGGGTEREVGGVKLATRVLDGVPAKELKGMVDAIKKQMGSGVVALVARDQGRASLVVGVTPDLTDRLSAVELVKAGSEALGGQGGGGRPDMAQLGGPDAGRAEAALAAIEQALAARSRAA